MILKITFIREKKRCSSINFWQGLNVDWLYFRDKREEHLPNLKI